MDFASYMGSLVILCQVTTELVCFFPFSFCVRFGLVAMGQLFFWLFLCVSPLVFFVSTQRLRTLILLPPLAILFTSLQEARQMCHVSFPR